MSGVFEITVKGETGTKIRIIPSEKADALGNPWRATESWCCYTLKGGQEERWKPKFTYGAGRYLQIALDPESRVQSMPEAMGVPGYFISSSAKDAGSFY